jgi:CheY-like chemotaxis protein
MDDRQQNAILVIDDDPGALAAIQAALEVSDYRVYTAKSGDEGIKLYETHWQEIKLVLLDYMMPEMTGDLVLEWLRMVNPDVRVLLVTGYGDVFVRKMLALRVCGYLKKPFTVSDLVQCVQDALDAPVVPASIRSYR